jgi:transcriptional regulator NrdR family protein
MTRTYKTKPTQSVRCPKCRGPTRVLRTTHESPAVVRERRCSRGHRFRTRETAEK